jgi:hypothetical protein
MKQNERNFWLDIGLSVTFLSTIVTGLFLWFLITHQTAAVFLGFNRHSWLTAHICSGLASAVGVVIHITWHQKWLKALRKRPIAILPTKLRANRVIDRWIWMAFLATSVFGALDWILPDENMVSLSNRLHGAFGMACLLGIAVHLIFHRQWITSAVKRYVRVKKEEMVIIQPGV